jgi:excisionase family DNA binding protein
MNARFLTLSQIRAMLNVRRATVWRWENEHGLKVMRVGGVVRVRESDLHAFLERHSNGAPADSEASENGKIGTA